MSTHTDVAHFTAPEAKPIAINGLIVGYARSTSRLTDSTDRQRQNLEAYAKANFGRGLDAFCKDRPSGTGSDSRPGLTALEHLARGKCSVIVVEEMDRISRKTSMVADFVMFCDDLGIQLHTLSAGLHSPSPWDMVSNDQLTRLRNDGTMDQLLALFRGQEQPALRELLTHDQYALIMSRASKITSAA